MTDLLEAFQRYFEVVLVSTDALREQVFRLRYQVYCVETRFEDAAHFPDEMERDAFDSQSVHALLRHRATGWWAGTVRLVLPASADPERRFPVEESCGPVFAPERLGNLRLPRETTAEVSRFAVSKEFRRRHAEYLSPTGVSADMDYDRRVYSRRGEGEAGGERRRPRSPDRRTHDEERKVVPHITLGLIQGLVTMSAEHAVSHWCAAMEPTLLRLLTRLGIYFQHVGPLVEYHGKRQPCIADLGSLLLGVRRQRRDVWNVLTLCGNLWSAREEDGKPGGPAG
jgi:N-acyl-L-homoserine lactone synthetase